MNFMEETTAQRKERTRELYRAARNTRLFYMAVVAIGLGVYYGAVTGVIAFVVWAVAEITFSWFERP